MLICVVISRFLEPAFFWTANGPTHWQLSLITSRVLHLAVKRGALAQKKGHF